MSGTFSTSDHSGYFVFKDHAAGNRQSLRVFYFLPDKITADTRIAVGMHGLDRKASDFRDVLAQPAGLHQMIVLVPEFDTEAFPDVYAYNYGNVRPDGPDAAVLQNADDLFVCETIALHSLVLSMGQSLLQNGLFQRGKVTSVAMLSKLRGMRSA